MEKVKKKQARFNKNMQKKLFCVFIMVMVALIGLNIRLTYINVASGDKYKKKVLSQQGFDSQAIPYKRGDILDRKGTVIATSERVYNLILDAKVATAKKTYIEPTIEALMQCFEVDEDQIRGYLNEGTGRYNKLLKQLTADQIKVFKDLQLKDSKKLINGVWFEEEYQRKYPYSTMACDLIGFTSQGINGFFGIEESYDEELKGTNGRQYGYLNDDLNMERTVRQPIDGNTVISTIDANIQSIVEKYINEFNETYRDKARPGAGSKNTAVLIQNVNTGEILAMASYPFFDLNNPSDLTGILTEEERAAADEKTISDVLNERWKNYCISNVFEPGSPIKPFTVATGIETGKMTGAEAYVCDGSELYPGMTEAIHCVNRSGHGIESVAKVLMNSCNDAIMQMSRTIGIADFTKYQEEFGFGKKTNIDLPGEEAGLIYRSEKMSMVDMATNAFGQNFNTTMIQVISGFSSLINGGYYYQPHVVKKIVNASGETVKTIEPQMLRQTISDSTSTLLNDYLYKTVEEGTANSAKVEGYSLGGKTGTAEKSPRKQGNYLVSFMGYGPVENPEIAIYVVIDEPNVADQAHSTYATEMSQVIMKEILPYLNIFPATGDEIVPPEGGDPIPPDETSGETPDTTEGLTGENEEGIPIT